MKRGQLAIAILLTVAALEFGLLLVARVPNDVDDDAALTRKLRGIFWTIVATRVKRKSRSSLLTAAAGIGLAAVTLEHLVEARRQGQR